MARRKNNNFKGDRNDKVCDSQSNQKDFHNSKHNSRNSRRDNEREERGEGLDSKSTADSKARSCNDPEWYSRDPALLVAAANLPFSEPLGTNLNLVEPNTDLGGWFIGSGSLENARNIPGICTLTVKPSIGTSLNRNSPINVAAQSFYTHVRYVNSGRKNYDQADLMMYALGVSDLYGYVSWLQRIYSCAFMYSQRNYYIGKQLLHAMDVNAENIINNLANFRYIINVFINKISSYAVPADISIFKRRAFMYAGLYTENSEGSIKDQIYLFKPHGFYYHDIDYTGKGMLNYLKIDYVSGGTLTVDKLAEIGNIMLANVFGDEDFGLMAGDIIKSYGSNIIGLAPMPEEFYTIPMYDEYVLSQFKNATIIGGLITKSEPGNQTWAVGDSTWLPPNNGGDYVPYGNIYQNEVGDIVSREGVLGENQDIANAWILGKMKMPLDINDVMPGPDKVIEATRLMAYGEGKDVDSEYRTVWINCGTEVVIAAEYFYTINRGNGSFDLGSTRVTRTAEHMNNTALSLSRAFKYAPCIVAYDYQDFAGGATSLRPESFELWQNFSNMTLITQRQLGRMHEVALLSLLYVPGISKVTAL